MASTTLSTTDGPPPPTGEWDEGRYQEALSQLEQLQQQVGLHVVTGELPSDIETAGRSSSHNTPHRCALDHPSHPLYGFLCALQTGSGRSYCWAQGI